MKCAIHLALTLLFSCSCVLSSAQTAAPPTEQKTAARSVDSTGPLEILTDTMGVDFRPYLQRVIHDVRVNWYNLIPEQARPPLMKKGKVTIEFAILKDGTVAGMKFVASSGDVALDRGAWGGIIASNPFPPLPPEFGGQYIGLRFSFYYNVDANDRTPTSPPGTAALPTFSLFPPQFPPPDVVPTSAPSKSGITVTIFPHPSVVVPLGGSQVVTATVKGTENPSVTWSVTGTGCSGPACGTMIDGLYTAPGILPTPPSVRVTAISQADPTAWAWVTVRIKQTDASRLVSRPAR